MELLRNTLSTIQRGGITPAVRGAGRKLNKQFRNGFRRATGNPDGTSIFDRDWDNLVVLDACRYDYFAEAIESHDVTGELRAHQSLGSCSREFVQRNFDGRELHDLVVVSANFWYAQVEKDFDASVDVHHLEFVDEREERNVGKPIAFPEHVTERARTIAGRFPDKRLLVHYHQPHAPYIGPTGVAHNDDSYHLNIPPEYVHDAYEETLREVLSELPELLPVLDGKTVITSDHGDLLGDRDIPIPVRLYGHPCEHYHEKLTTVPWFVVEHDDRKTVVSEPPTEETESIPADVREQRLRDLGYLQ